MKRGASWDTFTPPLELTQKNSQGKQLGSYKTGWSLMTRFIFARDYGFPAVSSAQSEVYRSLDVF